MSDPSLALAPGLTRLAGGWKHEIGGPTDDADARIFRLVSEVLEHVATSAQAWDQLFRDPRDGRYWELTFPHGSLHGGGPRELAVMDATAAAAKYGLPRE